MEPKTVHSAGDVPKARHIVHEQVFNAIPADASVLTLEGALPAGFLNPGDRVITRDSGMAILQDVRVATYHGAMVHVSLASLGNARPECDILLPAAQEILVRDWRAKALFGAQRALVPVQRLVDGTYIRDVGQQKRTMVQLVFEAPHIIYADGLELASTLGVGAKPVQSSHS